MVNELVIKPLVEIVRKTIVEYDKSLKSKDVMSPEEVKNFLSLKDTNCRFLLFLEDNKLNIKINKYLCPLLVIDFDKVRSLKENKNSIPTLEYDDKSEENTKKNKK
uniref:Uncharacterized protein n=1 Tax=viral metagenome TaxID=1070528 RepID=A0A6C0ACV1_9ZZZZ